MGFTVKCSSLGGDVFTGFFGLESTVDDVQCLTEYVLECDIGSVQVFKLGSTTPLPSSSLLIYLVDWFALADFLDMTYPHWEFDVEFQVIGVPKSSSPPKPWQLPDLRLYIGERAYRSHNVVPVLR